MTLKRFLILVLFSFLILDLSAQSKFLKSEKELNSQFESLKKAQNDSLRLHVSNSIMANLKQVLEEKSSFFYPFSDVLNLGKITSSDQKLRIFSWNCMLENGDYRYFALIQKKEKQGIQLFELHQKIGAKANMFDKLSSNQWLGALYYQIVPFKSRNRNLYLLLGWDGNTGRTHKKVIETLGFSKTGELELGFPVINWRGKFLTRVIFEYSKQVRMKLKYYNRIQCVVFDHLSPSEPRYNNQFEYYGPDFSFDALELKKGMWHWVEEFDLNRLD